MLITRPEPGASTWEQHFRQYTDVLVFKAPLLTIEPVVLTEHPDMPDALLITSPNAIPYAAQFIGVPVYAVGEQSAETARSAGLKVAGTGPGFAGEELFTAVPRGTDLLHLSGKHLAKDLAAGFAERGVQYRRAVVYEAIKRRDVPRSLIEFLGASLPKFATFVSSRTVEAFAALAQSQQCDEPAGGITAICASERIAATARTTYPFKETVVTGSTEAARFVDFATARRT